METLHKINVSFRLRMKDYQIVAKAKAKQGMQMMERQCHMVFRKEWLHLIDEYNDMRKAVHNAENKLALSQA